MTRLTGADIIAAHRRYYDDRQIMDAVAVEFGVTRRTLYNRFRELGLPSRPHRLPRAILSPDALAEARRRLDDGEALDDIAETFSVCGKTLRRRLIEAGYSARRGETAT